MRKRGEINKLHNYVSLCALAKKWCCSQRQNSNSHSKTTMMMMMVVVATKETVQPINHLGESNCNVTALGAVLRPDTTRTRKRMTGHYIK